MIGVRFLKAIKPWIGKMNYLLKLPVAFKLKAEKRFNPKSNRKRCTREVRLTFDVAYPALIKRNWRGARRETCLLHAHVQRAACCRVQCDAPRGRWPRAIFTVSQLSASRRDICIQAPNTQRRPTRSTIGSR